MDLIVLICIAGYEEELQAHVAMRQALETEVGQCIDVVFLPSPCFLIR
jgi:hypothetical protein